MALHTDPINGNTIATWVYSDFHDLLLGTMTDQPVTLNYSPAVNGSVPVLALVTNATNAPLLTAKANNALVLQVTSGGLLQDGAGHNYPIMLATGTATAGRQIFTGTTTPTGANEGDIWIKA